MPVCRVLKPATPGYLYRMERQLLADAAIPVGVKLPPPSTASLHQQAVRLLAPILLNAANPSGYKRFSCGFVNWFASGVEIA
jgi:hypothetical protein